MFADPTQILGMEPSQVISEEANVQHKTEFARKYLVGRLFAEDDGVSESFMKNEERTAYKPNGSGLRR